MLSSCISTPSFHKSQLHITTLHCYYCAMIPTPQHYCCASAPYRHRREELIKHLSVEKNWYPCICLLLEPSCLSKEQLQFTRFIVHVSNGSANCRHYISQGFKFSFSSFNVNSNVYDVIVYLYNFWLLIVHVFMFAFNDLK